jgi:uncharacterized protein
LQGLPVLAIILVMSGDMDHIDIVLKHLKNRLTELLGDSIEKMVLFGSRARGDFDTDSDIDIAIIVDGLDPTMKDSLYNAVAEIELEFLTPLSTLAMSHAVYTRLLKQERRIALDIEREGVPL